MVWIITRRKGEMMDKENLYYIVERGTNQRETHERKGTWIGEKDLAEKRAKLLSDLFKTEHEIMSIREYEDKFTEKEPEVKKEVSSIYSLYSTGKHLLGEYNNKVIILYADGYGVSSIITDPVVIKNIHDYMKYTGQFKKHAETLIEELIESTT